jgi:ATP-dependent DNA helicase MPH1
MSTVRARPDGRSLGWTYGVLKKVAALARAMGYLMESSVGMCHTSLRQIADEVSEDGKKASTLTKDPNFIATMGELEKQKRQPGGFKLHPKMVELKSLIVQHFGAQMADAEPGGEQGEEDSENTPPVRPRPGQNEGRVMVFAAFREVVEEIVEVLNQEQPLIRAIKLIGQSADKQGNSGLNQKAQQKVLKVVILVGQEAHDIN